MVSIVSYYISIHKSNTRMYGVKGYIHTAGPDVQFRFIAQIFCFAVHTTFLNAACLRIIVWTTHSPEVTHMHSWSNIHNCWSLMTSRTQQCEHGNQKCTLWSYVKNSVWRQPAKRHISNLMSCHFTSNHNNHSNDIICINNHIHNSPRKNWFS